MPYRLSNGRFASKEAAIEDSRIGKLYWHVHHEILAEFIDEPIQHRIKYIKEWKPEDEIETRLQWMTPVPMEKLPEAAQSFTSYMKHTVGWTPFTARFSHELNTLHAEDHGSECPWNGETLFPNKRRAGIKWN